ncbi:EamA family transporter [Calditerricola satsumensis]|uniref:EamA family transporter n=1 Tax=Calditerricola satsumensis TaxID=373054 RepID=UPI000A7289B4|nr:EamA family transporter [Calditerricola satsumensis]
MKDAALRFGALGLLSLIWGGSFFFIKILLEAMGPLSVAFFRTAFGLAPLPPSLPSSARPSAGAPFRGPPPPSSPS